jgi:hypothetical protein
MIDYSAVVDGQRKLQNALYQFILGIRGRRQAPVTRAQIMKWFHGTPESFVVEALAALLASETIIAERLKFRVMTVGDHRLKTDATLEHWKRQAAAAVEQGQSMTAFVASTGIDHRAIARSAY